MDEKEVIKRWGTDKQYFKELEAFHERHRNADMRVVDTESGVMVKVEYYFRPWQVAVEYRELAQKIREANEQPPTTGESNG